MKLTAIGEKLADTRLLELVPEFNAKMVRIMDAIGYLQNDDEAKEKGTFSGYTYTSARKVLDKVRKACVKEGISVESAADIQEFHIIGTKSLAVVKTTLYFTDGIFIAKAEGLGSGIDSGDKAVMKGDTASMKYACSGKFLISWGDDPEASGEDDDLDAREMLEHWLNECSKASNTSAEKFAPWWEVNGEKVKADCGDAAAQVYECYQTYLARLKAEAANATD